MLYNNVELQSKDKTVLDIISSGNALKQKMQHLASKLQCYDLANLKNFMSEVELQERACV